MNHRTTIGSCMLTLLLSLVAGFSGSARAAWEKSEVDVNGDTVYFDPASIRRYNSIVKILVLKDSLRPAAIEKETFRSLKANLEIDCSTGQVRVFFLSVYSNSMGAGRIIHFGKIDDDWQPIEEGSPGVALAARLCPQK